MPSTRSALRRQFRTRRRALSEQQRRAAARGLLRVAAGNRAFLTSRRIAFYLPNDGELDVTPLIKRAWWCHKRCFLPVLDTLKSTHLRFLRFEPGDALIDNRFGIPEPRRGVRQRVGPRSLDLILMPLVAFDSRGNRLGMGSGFYDRTLEYLRRRRHWHRPICYGIAYEFQHSEQLAPADWDIPLDGCLTDRGFHRFDARRKRNR